MRTTALLGLGFALWAGNAQALGPFQVYEQALRNDPEFLAALQERDAGQESRTIGRAGLLPKLSYNYNKDRNNSRATYLNERGNSHEDRNYNSYGSTFTVQQPLIDYEAYANYRKGVAQALFADETFRSKSQELLVRVLTHYTQALFAQDQADFSSKIAHWPPDVRSSVGRPPNSTTWSTGWTRMRRSPRGARTRTPHGRRRAGAAWTCAWSRPRSTWTRRTRPHGRRSIRRARAPGRCGARPRPRATCHGRGRT